MGVNSPPIGLNPAPGVQHVEFQFIYDGFYVRRTGIMMHQTRRIMLGNGAALHAAVNALLPGEVVISAVVGRQIVAVYHVESMPQFESALEGIMARQPPEVLGL